MNEKKIDWDDMRLFLAVARAGGLTAAAAETGKSAPTLGRRMLALESLTASELFHRGAKGYRLTPAGESLLVKATELANSFDSIYNPSLVKAKLVKVSAGRWVTHVLCENLRQIVDPREPIRLKFISTEETLDITHREAVIGIRNQRPKQPGLACRKLGQVKFAAYATHKDINTWVKVVGNTPSYKWLEHHLTTTQSIEHDIEVNSPRNALDLTCQGIAKMILPTFIGDNQKKLLRIGKPIPELTHDQWLVTHPDERFHPQVRLVIDRIVEVLAGLSG